MNAKQIAAYFRERFPPVNMMLFAILFFTVYSVARYFAPNDDLPVWRIAGGILATISFFFRLRVFDEIKDFGIDAINHPSRVLQSGKVSLKQLAAISMLLTVVEIAWSMAGGWQTGLCWSMALAYSLLMRYEFFAGRFLKKYLLLYSFTHMLIMPFIIVWIWSACVQRLAYSIPLALLCLLSLLGGYAFELARKIHAPAAERASVDSYSKSIGFISSICSVCICLLAGVVTQFYLLRSMHTRSWPEYLLVFLYIGTVYLYLTAINKQREGQLRTAEKFVSLFMLISYVSVIIETALR